jgi:hypothetical protein
MICPARTKQHSSVPASPGEHLPPVFTGFSFLESRIKLRKPNADGCLPT